MNPDDPIHLNREGRRGKIGRRLDIPANEPVNLGDCFYCGNPVFASPGQAITYRRITYKNGTVDNGPTHKRCRTLYLTQ